MAGDAIADSSWTVTRPSSTVTDLLNGFMNMERKITGLNCPPRVRLGQRVPFLPGRIRPRPSKQSICKLLSQLDAGLVERVDAVKLPRVCRCDFEKHHQLAYVRGIDAVQMDGHVWPAPLGQRASGRPLLDINQLA